MNTKYEGFELTAWAVIGSGSGKPIVLRENRNAVIDAYVAHVRNEDGCSLPETRRAVNHRFDCGGVFLARVALRGAFQNDERHESAEPRSDWITKAFDENDRLSTLRNAVTEYVLAVDENAEDAFSRFDLLEKALEATR